MEFWTATVAAPTRSAEFALEAEDRGWDGMNVVDSQNLSGDPYVCLALAATTTRSLRLATSVTNPVTRHPATTASSALSCRLRCTVSYWLRSASVSSSKRSARSSALGPRCPWPPPPPCCSCSCDTKRS